MSMSGRDEWQVVGRVFDCGDYCEGCVYFTFDHELDRMDGGDRYRCDLLEENLGPPSYCPQFEEQKEREAE
tara:strand:- start:138 stop:350 length:213 start_codon:yes stop_codon:yes gene_type:complete